MIQIQQDMAELSGLDTIIHRNSDVEIGIDVKAVQADIDKLNNKLSNPLSKLDKKNIKLIIEYLNKLLHKVSEDKLELAWNLEDYVLKSYPIELIHIPEYNIEMTDYISASPSKLVRVSYKEVLNLIAIELAYRDLGETKDSIEEHIENIGITGIYPAYKLLDIFEDNIYSIVKNLKVDDSPYRDPGHKAMVEYFGKELFTDKYYRSSLEYSGKHALAILTHKMLIKLGQSNVKYKLCSVSSSGIYFITDSNADIQDILKESVVVRVFGRKFEVQPRITIF